MLPVVLVLANPANCIQIHPALAEPQNPGAKDRPGWMETNEKLLLQMGARTYLITQLAVLSGRFVTAPEYPHEWSDDEILRLTINPAYAIDIHPSQVVPHQVAMSPATWIMAASELITDIGVRGFLEMELGALESDITEPVT